MVRQFVVNHFWSDDVYSKPSVVFQHSTRLYTVLETHLKSDTAEFLRYSSVGVVQKMKVSVRGCGVTVFGLFPRGYLPFVS